MKIITEKELKKRIGRETLVEREGVKGNRRDLDGVIREGELRGILEQDEKGFYVKMFQSSIGELPDYPEITTLIMDHSSFMDEVYWLQNMDIIRFLTPKRKTFGDGYSVRLSIE